MVEVQIGLISGLNMETKPQFSQKCPTLMTMSLLGLNSAYVLGKEVNVISVAMIDACGVGLQMIHWAGHLSLVNVDVIQMHMHTVTEDRENENVEVAEMRELPPAIGAGPGMMRTSGNPNMQPLDANLLEFEIGDFRFSSNFLIF